MSNAELLLKVHLVGDIAKAAQLLNEHVDMRINSQDAVRTYLNKNNDVREYMQKVLNNPQVEEIKP